MKGSHGFSLIEVVAGLSLFAIGILAIATVQIASVKNTGKAGSQSKDSFALLSFTEKLYALGFGSTFLTTGNHNDSDGDYIRFYKVKNHTSVNNLKVVEIEQRNIKNKIEKSVTLYISK